MEIVEGHLGLLGNSVSNAKSVTYSAIEIGDKVLQRKVVARSLDNFLRKALAESGASKLYLRGNVIVGVELPDGKIYCYKANVVGASIMIVVGIPAILFFGLGLLLIWQGVAELRNGAAADELAQRGGVPVSF